MPQRFPRRALLAAAACLPVAARAQHGSGMETRLGDLTIREPWTRAAGRGGQGAGYLAIENRGAMPDRLLAASSPASGRVELHTHVRDGDVMRMREVPAIDLPPGRTVMLEPSGLHLMLIGLMAPLERGGNVPMTLRFERAGEVTVMLTVQAAGARGHAH